MFSIQSFIICLFVAEIMGFYNSGYKPAFFPDSFEDNDLQMVKRYFEKKRAMAGEIRRSSIRWGKRSSNEQKADDLTLTTHKPAIQPNQNAFRNEEEMPNHNIEPNIIVWA